MQYETAILETVRDDAMPDEVICEAVPDEVMQDGARRGDARWCRIEDNRI